MLSAIARRCAATATRVSFTQTSRFAPTWTLARAFSTQTGIEGTVKWFDASKGFGFIVRNDDNSDLFVHFTAIQGDGYRSLEEGQRVQFSVGMGPKGPVATDVTLMQ